MYGSAVSNPTAHAARGGEFQRRLWLRQLPKQLPKTVLGNCLGTCLGTYFYGFRNLMQNVLFLLHTKFRNLKVPKRFRIGTVSFCSNFITCEL